MSKQTLKYEPGGAFLARIMELQPDDVSILCPQCESELIFAPNFESANEFKVHPGLHCPNEGCDFMVMFNLIPKKD